MHFIYMVIFTVLDTYLLTYVHSTTQNILDYYVAER